MSEFLVFINLPANKEYLVGLEAYAEDADVCKKLALSQRNRGYLPVFSSSEDDHESIAFLEPIFVDLILMFFWNLLEEIRLNENLESIKMRLSAESSAIIVDEVAHLSIFELEEILDMTFPSSRVTWANFILFGIEHISFEADMWMNELIDLIFHIYTEVFGKEKVIHVAIEPVFEPKK